MNENIVLFDGFCNFCSSSVRFIIKRDKQRTFRFASLQSEAGQKLLTGAGANNKQESIVLIEKGKYYFYSTAVLRIARKLRFPWNICFIFILIPRFLRDPIYKWFASKRYKWFGKRTVCFIPDEKVKSLFL